jgi:hypothetical protein
MHTPPRVFIASGEWGILLYIREDTLLIKMKFDWTDEMEELEEIERTTAKEANSKGTIRKATKEEAQTEWMFLDKFDKKNPTALIHRETKKGVKKFQELYGYIMKERYGDNVPHLAARNSPMEAVLTLKDVRAGRPFEGTDRDRAMRRLMKNEKAALKEWRMRKAGAV